MRTRGKTTVAAAQLIALASVAAVGCATGAPVILDAEAGGRSPLTCPGQDASIPDASCGYPPEPHEFGPLSGRDGAEPTVPPMRWPCAIAGDDVAGVPDLAALHCDPEVKGVFISVASAYCVDCPARLRAIAAEHASWDENGVRWIFLLDDATDLTWADEHPDRYGVTFGWRTTDGDNSIAPYFAVDQSPFVPWTAAIRTSDMALVYSDDLDGGDEPSFETLLRVAEELGQE